MRTLENTLRLPTTTEPTYSRNFTGSYLMYFQLGSKLHPVSSQPYRPWKEMELESDMLGCVGSVLVAYTSRYNELPGFSPST
jgi:hypothetical protein